MDFQALFQTRLKKILLRASNTLLYQLSRNQPFQYMVMNHGISGFDDDEGTDLVLHEVIQDVLVHLPYCVGNDGQVNALHLGFWPAAACCWVLLISRDPFLHQDTSQEPLQSHDKHTACIVGNTQWNELIYYCYLFVYLLIFVGDLAARTGILTLLVPLALAFLVHLHFSLIYKSPESM